MSAPLSHPRLWMHYASNRQFHPLCVSLRNIHPSPNSRRKWESPNICRLKPFYELTHCRHSTSFEKGSEVKVKKDQSLGLAKSHDPSEVESGWYDWWIHRGFFEPQQSKGTDKNVFSLLLPPPNVTGKLHLGHALTGAVQDCFVRWHRMSGSDSVWIPGTDHAGIATHTVVEKRLWNHHRKTRHDLGRDDFIKEIWKWKEEHGDAISLQMKRLGLSCDWSQQYFTMDVPRSNAVVEAFCQLYQRGLVNQQLKMVHWCPTLRSTLSDMEVDTIKFDKPTLFSIPGEAEPIQLGIMDKFAYPVVDSEERLVVSTTRLETMLADTAVCVNPTDNRYSHLIGKKVRHPLVIGRELTVIADNFVDISLGTGVVRITPGHDYTDFEVGQRHNLEIIECMDDAGTMIGEMPAVGGLSRWQARVKLREELSLVGVYCGQIDHSTSVPVCSRTGDIVEPRLKKQWFLNCKEMSQRAIDVVDSGSLQLIPEYNIPTWKAFLSNTDEWCLSRQLWWGHRIPVYKCLRTGKIVCATSTKDARSQLACELGLKEEDVEMEQEEDVLDTWFSSSLLPFSSMGWPKHTQHLEKYFPQQMLETGQDILFFWVARMVMMSLELTNHLPFKQVLLHGVIRDSKGRKMSKSLGNVVDPLDVIDGISLKALQARLIEGNLSPNEVQNARQNQQSDFPKGIQKCGADALRMALLQGNIKNVHSDFDVKHCEANKRFCNKIWQSFRFIFSKIGNGPYSCQPYKMTGNEDYTDQWILSQLSNMVHEIDNNFKSNDLHLVANSLTDFWHHNMCDIYLEAVKSVFHLNNCDTERQQTVRNILFHCGHTFLCALSPFMPFLSEELYQHLPAAELSDSICIADYPKPCNYSHYQPHLSESMNLAKELVYSVLVLRKTYQIMGSGSEVYIQSDDPHVLAAVEKHLPYILSVSRSSNATLIKLSKDIDVSGLSSGVRCVSRHIHDNLRVDVVLTDVDLAKEYERLSLRHKELKERIARYTDKLKHLEAKKKKRPTPQMYELRDKISKSENELSKSIERLEQLQSETSN